MRVLDQLGSVNHLKETVEIQSLNLQRLGSKIIEQLEYTRSNTHHFVRLNVEEAKIKKLDMISNHQSIKQSEIQTSTLMLLVRKSCVSQRN